MYLHRVHRQPKIQCSEHHRNCQGQSLQNPPVFVSLDKTTIQVVHEADVPLIVDNTFGMGGRSVSKTWNRALTLLTKGFLIRPIDHGADIVGKRGGQLRRLGIVFTQV